MNVMAVVLDSRKAVGLVVAYNVPQLVAAVLVGPRLRPVSSPRLASVWAEAEYSDRLTIREGRLWSTVWGKSQPSHGNVGLALALRIQ